MLNFPSKFRDSHHPPQPHPPNKILTPQAKNFLKFLPPHTPPPSWRRYMPCSIAGFLLKLKLI